MKVRKLKRKTLARFDLVVHGHFGKTKWHWMHEEDDGGIVSCVEAKTGTEVWRERVGGNFSASPLSAEGRLYFFGDDGKTTVLEASRQFKKIGQGKLDGGFMASPAVSGKALLERRGPSCSRGLTRGKRKALRVVEPRSGRP